jgi:hypothetical protein
LKTYTCAVAAALLCAATAMAQEASARLYFPANGFSIAPLDAADDRGPYQILVMMLPATQSFAPSVNVQSQPFAGTLEQFVSLSRQQFEAEGLSVASESIRADTVTWEYTGEARGLALHWYATAHAGRGKIYLVTATALEQQWDAVSPDLKKCVESFRWER